MSHATPTVVIRRADPADAAGVLAVYGPVVTETAISFEATPPGEAELARRIVACNETYSWLVAESNGLVTGYAYATTHRPRHAYRYSVETSVYVHPAHQARGVGAALYQRLLTDLATLGYYQAFAAITLPNEASTRLHTRAGFQHIGTFPHVGFKFGRWHDVSWWHRTIQAGTPVE